MLTINNSLTAFNPQGGQGFTHLQVAASSYRVPQVAPHTVVEVAKRGRRSAVVMHPDDFDFAERLVDVFSAGIPSELRMSDEVIAAHRLGERGEDEDADEYYYSMIDAALG